MTLEAALWSVAIGLAAGLLGGLAGIGGSMVMIPALFLVFGDNSDHTNQHVFMAAAMAVNVVVAIPATYRHSKAGAVRMDLAKYLLPSMAATIVAGVLVSDRVSGLTLRWLLAVFIAGYCILNLYRAVRPRPTAGRPPERTHPALLVSVGGATGFVGGLLGIGGGVLMVPAMQVLARVRLREAIATSSMVMCVTAAIGSGLKLSTLSEHGRSAAEAGLLALAMSPGAIVGALVGATLTHRLPLRAVRVLISILLLGAAAKLAGVF
jgi:uncharacterized protein